MNKAKQIFDKVTESKITHIVNAVSGATGLLLYLSMHSVLGFIGYFTFKALPYILGTLLIVSTVFALILLLYKNNKAAQAATLVYNGLMFIASLAYFIGFYSYSRIFLLEIAKILLFYIFFAIVVYLCFFHGKIEYKGKKAVAITLCAVMIIGSTLCFTDFDSLRINYIACDPVVYAVENDYQIVWTTAAKGSGWVEIGGNTYYDEYAGQIKTSTKVHKVTVPQSVLDDRREYTVKSKAIISEQGFSGLFGYTIKATRSFRPVNTEDGIQTYVLTDTHDFNGAAAKAAAYHGDKLDFLVLAGDHINFIDDPEHFTRILSLADKVTKGMRPVVFARGNHELKCPQSEMLDKYVGSLNEKFYYTFRLKNVWGVVLDMGENYDDDWKEFYGTAAYDGYRKDQIAFLDKIIADKENEYAAEGIEYRLGICHINTAVSDFDEPYMFDTLVNINERLNQMNLDLMISGHLHKVYMIEKGYEVGRPLFYRAEYAGKTADEPEFLATGATYPSVIAGKHGNTFDCNGKELMSEYTGTAISFEQDGKYVRFTNKKKEVLYTISPFDNIDYGRIIEL